MPEDRSTNDVYTTLGAITELMTASPYHSQQEIKVYYYFHIFPAISFNQLRVYYSDDGVAEAFLTWAWLTDEIIEEMTLNEDRLVKNNEWNCGAVLFFNDFIAPYGNMRDIFKDIFTNVFSKVDRGFSIRRNMDGSIRKKNTWHRHKFV